jgi:hypothetical protein
MASRALQDLPQTNQSVVIRKKLRAFKQGMLRDCIVCSVISVGGVVIAALLPDYLVLIGGYMAILGLLPGAEDDSGDVPPFHLTFSSPQFQQYLLCCRS